MATPSGETSVLRQCDDAWSGETSVLRQCGDAWSVETSVLRQCDDACSGVLSAVVPLMRALVMAASRLSTPACAQCMRGVVTFARRCAAVGRWWLASHPPHQLFSAGGASTACECS